MKEIMKNMDLRISELSIQMGISRPTMYKFIEMYENGNYNLINSNVLKLFRFIEKNQFSNKNIILKYILNDLSYDSKISEEKLELLNLVKSMTNPQAKKALEKLKGE
ncbi:hypothetical protein [[Acholeplasma] multilocale]|uniref:hypothetical protein n=1 Tax=[Acholeplasma] multilocale TaxID=264638 RepID=UPI0006859D1E|nr:hypothetical protein [[Acholeplasma] multilocale]